MIISPEQVVTGRKRLIEHLAPCRGELRRWPGTAGGSARLLRWPLVGNELRELRKHMPNVDTRVAAIFRRGRPIIPEGNTVIEADDEVFFIAAKNDIRAVMSELRRLEHNYKRIVIAGGGNIGYRLAKTIQHRYNVKVLERMPNRAEWLGEKLHQTVVLQGLATDRDELLKANIEHRRVLRAHQRDEANIMASCWPNGLARSRW